MTNARKMTLVSILVAQALVLHIIERMIPVPFLTPGAKLGLANIITVISLYLLTLKDSFLVVIVRVVLATLLGGNLSGFFYSITGGLLSLFAMYGIKKIGGENISIIGVSVVGSFFHNLGQVIVAAFIINNVIIISYLPILMLAGVGTGIFVGITGNFLFGYLRKINLRSIN
jgi:heptaprenyl diphosphate synthase